MFLLKLNKTNAVIDDFSRPEICCNDRNCAAQALILKIKRSLFRNDLHHTENDHFVMITIYFPILDIGGD